MYYHPDNYKSQFCEYYPYYVDRCSFGDMCPFAHTLGEISIDLLHLMEPKDPDFYCFYFKTVWCPFLYEHEKDKCVYAHNWYDFRRRIQFLTYSEETCPNWTNKQTLLNYEDGCPNGKHCSMSHG